MLCEDFLSNCLVAVLALDAKGSTILGGAYHFRGKLRPLPRLDTLLCYRPLAQQIQDFSLLGTRIRVKRTRSRSLLLRTYWVAGDSVASTTSRALSFSPTLWTSPKPPSVSLYLRAVARNPQSRWRNRHFVRRRTETVHQTLNFAFSGRVPKSFK